MSESKNIDFDTLSNVIQNIHNDIYISGHKNADYDSMCSSLALALILKKLNKKVKVFIEKNSIEKVKYFKCNDLLTNTFDSKDYTFIVLDLNRISRLPDSIEKYYKDANLTINIDHHNGNLTNANYIISNPSKSSTCEMIYDLIDKLNIELDKQISELIFTGIISDTNSFMNSTSPETFFVASKLMNTKIDGEFLINKFYYEKTETELEVIASIINNIKFDEFHYSILNMREEPFNKISYVDISKKCMPTISSNKSINVLMLIMDYGDKKKGEIRSKGNVDVSALASILTGGGHTNAAGFSNKKSISEIIEISKNYLRGVKQNENN